MGFESILSIRRLQKVVLMREKEHLLVSVLNDGLLLYGWTRLDGASGVPIGLSISALAGWRHCTDLRCANTLKVGLNVAIAGVDDGC